MRYGLSIITLSSDCVRHPINYAGRFAQFVVSPNNGYVRFQNVHDPSKFLAIRDGFVTWGAGMAHCEFYITTVAPNVITIKSAHAPGM